MGLYKIVCVRNSDYCDMRPSDQGMCQYTEIIEADSKLKAVRQLHSLAGFATRPGGNMLPMIWEITEIKQ